MILTSTHATRPLSAAHLPQQATGAWRVESVQPEPRFEAALLASFTCSCNGNTLLQIHRATDFDAPVQLVLTCSHDGDRVSLPYRRMPWVVEDYMRVPRAVTCGACGANVATLLVFDGVPVGVELACPLCNAEHAINLTLSALPAELRHAAFGLAPPRPMLSPPVYAVLRMMWECIQRQPANSFSFAPYTLRDDSGVLRHDATGIDAEVAIDHLGELLNAGLIEEGHTIAISKSGVIVCLREFGQR